MISCLLFFAGFSMRSPPAHTLTQPRLFPPFPSLPFFTVPSPSRPLNSCAIALLSLSELCKLPAGLFSSSELSEFLDKAP